jgi:hypothetical protein
VARAHILSAISQTVTSRALTSNIQRDVGHHALNLADAKFSLNDINGMAHGITSNRSLTGYDGKYSAITFGSQPNKVFYSRGSLSAARTQSSGVNVTARSCSVASSQTRTIHPSALT